ncbi:MAG: hypothetical protein CL675_03155 [Bdellovibrionaceae bacterium]|nr:hypothetical protein [Pseudobdellovibrionaceae bacterium]
MTTTSLLKNLYLFKRLNEDQLQVIADMARLESVAAGEDVFLQGSEAKALYIIKLGSVRIHQKSRQGENIEVATLGAGSHFGEMPLLDSEARSASATTLEESDIVAIDYDKLKTVLETRQDMAISIYRELALFLCGRLRITTSDLSFSREKNLSHF